MNTADLTTHTHRIRYYTTAGTYACLVSIEPAPFHGRAGIALGEMWLRREGDLEPSVPAVAGTGQDIPADERQYAFTHGGEEYRAACRAVWAALQAVEHGAIVDTSLHGGDPCRHCHRPMASCSPSGRGTAACDECGTVYGAED